MRSWQLNKEKIVTNNEGKGLIIKYQIMNFLKNQFLIKNYHVGRQPWKNNKVKYPTIKKFKTQTMQTKYGIKTK
jgi:hypothetical protein